MMYVLFMNTIKTKATVRLIAIISYLCISNSTFFVFSFSLSNDRLGRPCDKLVPFRTAKSIDIIDQNDIHNRGDVVLNILPNCYYRNSFTRHAGDNGRLWLSKTRQNVVPTGREVMKLLPVEKDESCIQANDFTHRYEYGYSNALENHHNCHIYENYDGIVADDKYYYTYKSSAAAAAKKTSARRSSTACLFFTSPFVSKVHTQLGRRNMAISAVSDNRSSFVSEEPMLCKHLKLGQLFSKSDEYVFRITKNIRFYEWTSKEVETMYNDFIESFDEEKYELNQMIVMKEKDCMEVADGQQRLISLCLLLAAMRDEAADDEQGRLFAQEIKSRLIYTAYSKPPLPRVRLRRKDDGYFQMLLSATHDVELNHDPSSSNLKNKQSPTAEQLMMENYKTFRFLIANSANPNDSMTTKQQFIDRLFLFVTEQVYVYLTIPESHVVARKLIMGARKGKDFEPIDELKGLVVFNGIQDELTQDIYLEKWLDFIDRSGRREVAGNACILLAQSYLGKRVKQNQEYEILEEFFREGRRAGHTGESFYDDMIVPGILSLEKLRGDASLDSGFPKEDIQRITFIRDAAKARVAAKEVEIAAVHALLAGRRQKKNSFSFQSKCLEVIERLALLFLTTDVTLANRYQRVFDMVASIKNGKVPTDLDASEIALIRQSLDETHWGVSGMKSKIVVPIIMRLNRDMMLANGDILLSGETKSTLEHILPQKPVNRSRWISDWSDHDREKWLNRLGNLCLLHKRGNSSAKNHDFIEKKAFYRQSSLPLTTQIAQNEKWTVDEAIRQHKYLLSLADHSFGLTLN